MRSSLAFYSGVAVVVGTHTWMLTEKMPPSIQQYHAITNLVAAALILYGA